MPASICKYSYQSQDQDQSSCMTLRALQTLILKFPRAWVTLPYLPALQPTATAASSGRALGVTSLAGRDSTPGEGRWAGPGSEEALLTKNMSAVAGGNIPIEAAQA